jgi:phenylpropionate dioxygenase-like ring-hydroxylating dioxygenase large terminal subunit
MIGGKTMTDCHINTAALETVKQKLKEGVLPQWTLTDPDIYQLEVENIFAKTWYFLGHESELEESGSYVTRWIVNDPILLVRNTNGEIKAFLNSCAHRGPQLCTSDFGKKKTFTCPYHGWTFNLDGDLIGIVAGNKVYGEEMDKSEWGLRPIPRMEIYKGLIFANLDPSAESLEDYLGDMKWYLDIILSRSDQGLEVRGVPHRWVVKANWKNTAENFMADPYHVQSVHRSTVEMGISPEDPMYAGYGHQIVLENGHGLNVITSKTGRSPYQYQTLPEEMWPMFERNLSPEQADILSRVTVCVGGVYPNLSFLSPIHKLEGNKAYNYFNLRVWRPVGPDHVEIWSWFLIDKEAPETYKEGAYKGYVGTFGPSGTLEQDDTEVLARVVDASKGIMARDKSLSYNNMSNYLMGYERIEPDEEFLGPGTAYPTTYIDTLARNIHEHWLKLLCQDQKNAKEDNQ